jgi:dipeptidyl aminopeptidase/acylaminoacyl peptidase
LSAGGDQQSGRSQDTHKFESRYLDSLIGPYPQDKAVYEERSPINALDRFNTPVALFQARESWAWLLN